MTHDPNSHYGTLYCYQCGNTLYTLDADTGVVADLITPEEPITNFWLMDHKIFLHKMMQQKYTFSMQIWRTAYQYSLAARAIVEILSIKDCIRDISLPLICMFGLNKSFISREVKYKKTNLHSPLFSLVIMIKYKKAVPYR